MIFKNVAHGLEPGETPSNLATHQAPNYVQSSNISQNMVTKRQNINLPGPERHRMEQDFFFQFDNGQYCNATSALKGFMLLFTAHVETVSSYMHHQNLFVHPK